MKCLKSKLLFPAILVGTVVLSMCLTSDNTDITAVVKLLPDVQQFLNEHPDAEIKAALWSASSVDANIEGIRTDCGPQMESKGYWKAEVKEKNLNLIIWLDNETRQPVCVVRTGIPSAPLPSTTSLAQTTPKAATSTASPATSAAKTSFQLQDLDDVLLNGNDVAPGYTINQFRTGVVDDALQYHEGNAERARELVKYGWKANKAIQFDYEIANVTGAKYITVSASLYDKPTEYFACTMKWRLEDSPNLNWQRLEGMGQDVELGSITTTSFGAPLTGYHVRGYYSNVFVNLDLGGYARSVTKEEAKGYAKLISDRLKSKCPACQLSPSDCSLIRPTNNASMSTGTPTPIPSPTSTPSATISIQDIGKTTMTFSNSQYLRNPSVQITNTGPSDLTDITLDVTLLKDGQTVKKDVDVSLMSGYDSVDSVPVGDSVIGNLYWTSPTDLNGHYTLKIDLRKGASTKIIATDSEDFSLVEPTPTPPPTATPAPIINAAISIQDVGKGAVGTWISSPSVQITNTGPSDITDLALDITLLKDGQIVKKDVGVYLMSGYNLIRSVLAGNSVIGTLNYMSSMDLNGHYTLKIDLRNGAGITVLSTDSKDFDVP